MTNPVQGPNKSATASDGLNDGNQATNTSPLSGKMNIRARWQLQGKQVVAKLEAKIARLDVDNAIVAKALAALHGPYYSLVLILPTFDGLQSEDALLHFDAAVEFLIRQVNAAEVALDQALTHLPNRGLRV